MRIEVPEFNSRTVGALAFAFGALLLAFTAGRQSVWLVPLAWNSVTTSAGRTSKPPLPLYPVATSKPASQATTVAAEYRSQDPVLTVINADAAGALAQSDTSDASRVGRTTDAMPTGLERCARRYQSFDPTDGTYKPYGRDERVLCVDQRGIVDRLGLGSAFNN